MARDGPASDPRPARRELGTTPAAVACVRRPAALSPAPSSARQFSPAPGPASTGAGPGAAPSGELDRPGPKPARREATTATLLTIGHGTLTASAFTDLLAGAQVRSLVDIRSFPGSRRHPHMSREAMATWVPEAGVSYRWEPRLGGRRQPVAGSPHVALRNPAFRAYADHMMSADFHAGLEEVLAPAVSTPTAVMCAETLWWRCHRRLTADAATLLARAEVLHVMHDGTLAAHIPTDGVRRADNQLIYDVGAERPLPL